jgi:hypothetical protein
VEQVLEREPELAEVEVVESQSHAGRARAWNIAAAVALFCLAVSPVIQESFRRSIEYAEAPHIANDFPEFYIAGQIVKLKAPNNLLYYLPNDLTSWSLFDLRTDATTAYGRFSQRNPNSPPTVLYPFITPPLSALMMEPFTSLSWEKAYFVWQLLSVLMMMASLYLALRLAQEDLSPVVMTIALVAVFLFLPFQRVLAYGNIDALIVFLWVAGTFALWRGYTIPSALCFALGTAIKFSPILAVPLLAMRRQWRWLITYSVGCAVLLALSVWRLGWQNHIVWAGQVAPAISWGVKTFANRSLPGLVLAITDPRNLLSRWPSPSAPSWRLLNRFLSGIGYCGFLFWCWRQSKESKKLPVEMILLPLVIFLVSPFSWTTHYALAVLPLTSMWVRLRQQAVGPSSLDLILLTASTVFIGSVVPDRAAVALGTTVQLAVMAGWVASAMALLWVGMSMYRSGGEETEHLIATYAELQSTRGA